MLAETITAAERRRRFAHRREQTRRADDTLVAESDAAFLSELGVDGVAGGSIAGGCVELTERRLHVRGPFAKALLRGDRQRGWSVPGAGRELRITPVGARDVEAMPRYRCGRSPARRRQRAG